MGSCRRMPGGTKVEEVVGTAEVEEVAEEGVAVIVNQAEDGSRIFRPSCAL